MKPGTFLRLPSFLHLLPSDLTMNLTVFPCIFHEMPIQSDNSSTTPARTPQLQLLSADAFEVEEALQSACKAWLLNLNSSPTSDVAHTPEIVSVVNLLLLCSGLIGREIFKLDGCSIRELVKQLQKLLRALTTFFFPFQCSEVPVPEGVLSLLREPWVSF